MIGGSFGGGRSESAAAATRGRVTAVLPPFLPSPYLPSFAAIHPLALPFLPNAREIMAEIASVSAITAIGGKHGRILPRTPLRRQYFSLIYRAIAVP
jgi:hypothetical protein